MQGLGAYDKPDYSGEVLPVNMIAGFGNSQRHSSGFYMRLLQSPEATLARQSSWEIYFLLLNFGYMFSYLPPPGEDCPRQLLAKLYLPIHRGGSGLVRRHKFRRVSGRVWGFRPGRTRFCRAGQQPERSLQASAWRF